VAPFWADVNTLVAGDIFYRETLDQDLLQQATIDVSATSAICRNYTATWLFIATWFEVAFYGAQGDYRNSTV